MPASGSSVLNSPPTAFVADASLMGRQLAAYLLQRRHCSVESFSTLEELVGRMSSAPAELVIVDVNLPDFAEPDLLPQLLKTSRPGSRWLVALTLDREADLERCRAAGFDDAVQAPLEPARVDALLARLHAPAIDVDETLRRLGGNRALLTKLVGVLSQSIAAWTSELDAGFADGDGERIRRTAHQMKGALGNFAAESAVAGAKQLEEFAKTGDLASARAACDSLWEEIARVQRELAHLTP